MKFMHPDFAAPFSFEGGGVCAYVFENPAYFRRMTGELIDQLEGERGAFVLSGEDGELMELGRNAELFSIRSASLSSRPGFKAVL